METDIKDKLAQLEAQVAVIKDPALRQIAFGKLLDTAIEPCPAVRSSRLTKRKSSDNESAKSKGKSKTASFYALAQIREPVQKLALAGTLKDSPNFKEMGDGYHRNLWILAAAKQGGIEGLNNHEIAYILTKRLYKPTKYSTVNHIRDKVGLGHVFLDPETDRWVITPEGEAFVKKRKPA